MTRLLQSSLSGHGRVSLICTVTPSSSNAEETHCTLKFAHRAKHIEIQVAQNKIVDEKSLIKKYQNEIRLLKEELEQLKSGTELVPHLKNSNKDDLFHLKQKLEDGQVELQSRLEQEEEAKEALLNRIQSLTKLILVSNKSSHASRFSHRPGLRRGHSFGEEELAYLPQRRRDLSLEDENTELYVSLDGSAETNNDVLKEEKKIKRPGLLNWLKLRKRESVSGALTSTSDKSSGAKSISPLSTPSAGNRNPVIEHSHPLPTECTSSEYLSDSKQDQQNNEDNFSPQDTPLTSIKTIDQIDLLREQQRVLSGEVAIHLSTLEQLSDETARDTKKEFLNVEITRLHDEIERNNEQISLLEGHISDSDTSSRHKMDEVEQSRSFLELEAQLNEKSFELEVRTADNRVIQEQLDLKV
ncbi:kinesin-like protein KIN-7K, chloroplastic isoform X1, partial [Tanacetum coccineum]